MPVKEFTLNTLVHPCSFHNEAVRIYNAVTSEDGRYGVLSNEFVEGSCEVINLEDNNWVYLTNVDYKQSIKYIFKKIYETDWLHIMLLRVEDGNIFSYIEFLHSDKNEANDDQSVNYGRQESNFLIQPVGKVKVVSLFIHQDWLKETIWHINFNDETLSALQNNISFNKLTVNTLYEKHGIGNILDKINSRSEKCISSKAISFENLMNDFLTVLFPKNYFNQSIKDQRAIKGIMEAERQLVSDFKSTPLTLDTLAKISGLNRVKFQQLFKEIYGTSFYQYYQCARFNYAKNLIETGNYNISEVAYRVGFKNLSHFSTKFLTIIGVSPGNLKRQIENNRLKECS